MPKKMTKGEVKPMRNELTDALQTAKSRFSNDIGTGKAGFYLQ